jgi:restriction system protein
MDRGKGLQALALCHIMGYNEVKLIGCVWLIILEPILDVAKVRSRPTVEEEEQQGEAKVVEREPKKRRGRRSLGSVPRGEYRFPILETLMEIGSEGKVLEVMTKVEERMKDRLTSVDYQTLKGGEKRWEKNAHWMRYQLVKEGCLAKDSPRGIWRITDKGKALYRELEDRL